HRDARDEAVDGTTPARFGGCAYVAREVAARVDHRVPCATGKTGEGAPPVPDEPLDVGIQLRVRRAAVEEGQLVAALERRVGDRTAEEPRAAEEEQLHRSVARPSSRRSTSSSVL